MPSVVIFRVEFSAKLTENKDIRQLGAQNNIQKRSDVKQESKPVLLRSFTVEI